MSFGINKVRSSVPLSRSVLEEFLKYPPIPGERDKKPQRIAKMTEWLESGSFCMVDWAICHCREDDVWYRVNGQHSSHVLDCLVRDAIPECVGSRTPRKIEAEFPDGIPCIIKEAYCDTKEELLDVFDLFDSKASARSDDDKLGIFMASHDELRFMDKEPVKDALKGVHWLRTKDSGNKHQDLAAVNVPDAHERGRYLSVQSVRDFCVFISEHPVTPFPYRKNPASIAAVYEAWLPQDETSETIVEALLYEVDDAAKKSGDEIRKGLVRKGHDANWYWTRCSRAINSISRVVDKDRDVLKALIREVMDGIDSDAQPQTAV